MLVISADAEIQVKTPKALSGQLAVLYNAFDDVILLTFMTSFNVYLQELIFTRSIDNNLLLPFCIAIYIRSGLNNNIIFGYSSQV